MDNMKKMIYLDNAATTKTSQEVVDAMLPYFTQYYGNASAVYDFGAKAREAMNRSRETIGELLNTDASNIYFTAGGSESDNWALRGIAESYGTKGRHIITTSIEHHAVLHTCQYLEKHGFEVTYLPVDSEGMISAEDLEEAIREDTILISVMFANNEIGTIEPVRRIGEIAHRRGVLFHTDAVQAFGHVPIDVEEMKIDLLSASGHKFHGPKGVGFLYVRKGVKISPLIYGGAQESRRRAGTENIPGIVGLGRAAELAAESMEARARRETRLRDYLIDEVLRKVPYTRCNGSRGSRLPNNASFCFRFIEGESLLIMLDMNGICGSSGSACTSGSLDPSHVLLAIGLPHEIAHGSLRLTLGEDTTKEDIDRTVDAICKIVERLRSMSPLYEDFIRQKSAK